MSIPVNFLTWICALLPILAILVLMVYFKWSASKAGCIGWFIAMVVALTVFKEGLRNVAFSNARGMPMAFYVLYIIWGALFLYHIVDEVGGIESIGATFVEMTRSRILQLLMVGFAFVTFLQGVAGFGVPVAVGAPLLVGLGFDPVTAVAVPLIGHSWSVTFGDMASSFAALQASTGLSAEALAPYTAAFTGFAGIVCAFFAIHCFAGFKGIKKGWGAALVVAGCMSATQWLVAQVQPTLATFLAGIVGMLVVALLSRLPKYRKESAEIEALEADTLKEAAAGTDQFKGRTFTKKMPFKLAFAAYFALIIIVALQEFVPGLEGAMKQYLVLKLNFPQYATGFGYLTPAGPSKDVSLVGHVGALLVYGGIIGIIVYSISGHWKPGTFKTVIGKVAKDGAGSSLATTAMVLMAFIMMESGMTYTLAKGISVGLGSIYPVFAPLVGVLGAFMTGSNTNSNVMFGAFQKQVASLLGISTLIMASAQTAGGSIGSMLAPAKVLVGTSTVGLDGREGEVIGKTLAYCLILGVTIGIIAWLLMYVFLPNVQ
jgi:lactate permease